ncbi:MAG: ABC transporter permease subunit [Oscillospiraceae bacterium]|jgi:putative aldouronate transport system permease protein|nr:ABC transporter permease subunit [Oscillospiraceae bacterium]
MRLSDIKKDWIRNKSVYFLAIPLLLYFFIFQYLPIGGMTLAFQHYDPRGGTVGSEWIGISNFFNFFSSYYFGRLIRNTLIMSVYSIIINFPAPIVLALLLNEMENQIFKKTVQTLSYMPYFVSTVVICGIIQDFVGLNGPITAALVKIGMIPKAVNLLTLRDFWTFRTIFVFSGMWQGTGYGSIIYLAILSSVDQELYEAAKIDGAGRWKQTLHVTIPGISSMIMMMVIMQASSLLSVAMDKIILLYSPAVYEVADVLMSFVYRSGIVSGEYGYSTAVQIFNTVVSMILLVTANALSRKYSEFSLF